MNTVADALMDEIRRVRDEVMPSYYALPFPALSSQLAMMRRDLDAAVKALAYQDGIECIRLLAALKGYKL